MQKEGIKRLPVVDRGKLMGIISMKDIAVASQQLITIIGERKRLTETPVERLRSPLYGYCDRCRQWSSYLREVEGQFLCEECRIDLGISEE
jgi:CBS-domain-containing membrane protein